VQYDIDERFALSLNKQYEKVPAKKQYWRGTSGQDIYAVKMDLLSVMYAFARKQQANRQLFSFRISKSY
jgi:hypothetical protein